MDIRFIIIGAALLTFPLLPSVTGLPESVLTLELSISRSPVPTALVIIAGPEAIFLFTYNINSIGDNIHGVGGLQLALFFWSQFIAFTFPKNSISFSIKQHGSLSVHSEASSEQFCHISDSDISSF